MVRGRKVVVPNYIVAIDQGIKSTQAIIFDKEGHLRCSAEKEIEQYRPDPGWVEQVIIS